MFNNVYFCSKLEYLVGYTFTYILGSVGWGGVGLNEELLAE